MVDKYKARLVVKGCRQKYWVGFDILFVSVGRRTSFNYFMNFVDVDDLECHNLDFTTAFLNGKLEEDILIEQPDLYQDGSNTVLKLQKALCGLKQAPRSWYKALTGEMKKTGCIFCLVDGAVGCIHLCGQRVVVLVHVVAVLVAARCLSAVEAAKHLLLSFFDGNNKVEVCKFLGYQIHQDLYNHRTYLDQSSCTKKTLSEAGYGLNDISMRFERGSTKMDSTAS
jgi:hypothetical protein